MSYAEVLDEVQSWPSDDRQKLAPHLKILEIINDPATMERVSRGIEEIEAGRGGTREQLLAHLATRGITIE